MAVFAVSLRCCAHFKNFGPAYVPFRNMCQTHWYKPIDQYWWEIMENIGIYSERIDDDVLVISAKAFKNFFRSRHAAAVWHASIPMALSIIFISSHFKVLSAFSVQIIIIAQTLHSKS